MRSEQDVVGFSSKIPGYYDQDELTNLLKYVRQLPKSAVIVEIGVECGRSASVFLQCPENWAELHLIDSRTHNSIMGRKWTSCLLGKFQIQDWTTGGFPDPESATQVRRPRSMGTDRMPQNMIYDREVSSEFAADHWQLLRAAEKEIDLIHIDGDHTADGVWWDCKLWLPKLKVGGIVVFHDYQRKGADPTTGSVFPGVDQAVDWHTGPDEGYENLGTVNTQAVRRKL